MLHIIFRLHGMGRMHVDFRPHLERRQNRSKRPRRGTMWQLGNALGVCGTAFLALHERPHGNFVPRFQGSPRRGLLTQGVALG